MLRVHCYQHRDGVCLEITQATGGRSRVYDRFTAILSPEAARLIGVGLIEDAAAADCYRREVGADAEEANR